MTSIISNLLGLIQAYFLLKNKELFSKIYEDHQKKKEKYIYEIEKNRNIGTNQSNDVADVLRSKLSEESRQFEHLSTLYLKAQEKCANSNH